MRTIEVLHDGKIISDDGTIEMQLRDPLHAIRYRASAGWSCVTVLPIDDPFVDAIGLRLLAEQIETKAHGFNGRRGGGAR
jgi:hypothetical protein